MKEKIEIDEIRKIELAILKEIDKVCRENNIKYSIIGGTLIGAIRHKGFIPWDDDIDIAMTRGNYNKFKEIFKHEQYKILCYDNTNNYYYPYIKVIDTETEIFEKKLKNFEGNGIFVDVFPIDITNTHVLQIKYIQIIGYIRNLIAMNKETIKTKKIIQRLLYPIVNKINVNSVCKYMDTIAQKNNNKNFTYAGTICAGTGNKNDIVSKKIFDKYIDLEFEGFKVMAIKEYEQFLRHRFGNYMKLPPKEEQITNHSFEAYKINKRR